jgi:hypothetical protein
MAMNGSPKLTFVVTPSGVKSVKLEKIAANKQRSQNVIQAKILTQKAGQSCRLF